MLGSLDHDYGPTYYSLDGFGKHNSLLAEISYCLELCYRSHAWQVLAMVCLPDGVKAQRPVWTLWWGNQLCWHHAYTDETEEVVWEICFCPCNSFYTVSDYQVFFLDRLSVYSDCERIGNKPNMSCRSDWNSLYNLLHHLHFGCIMYRKRLLLFWQEKVCILRDKWSRLYCCNAFLPCTIPKKSGCAISAAKNCTWMSSHMPFTHATLGGNKLLGARQMTRAERVRNGWEMHHCWLIADMCLAQYESVLLLYESVLLSYESQQSLWHGTNVHSIDQSSFRGRSKHPKYATPCSTSLL